MRRTHIFIIVLIITMAVSFGLTITLLHGCSFDRHIEVESGYYTPLVTELIHDSSAAELINSLHIDRKNWIVMLLLEDETTISNSYTVRPRQDWPSGCPANLGSTKMEILDLNVNAITIGKTVIHEPIIVRNCPDEPERVILRENGQLSGTGTACAQNSACVHFMPEKPGT